MVPASEDTTDRRGFSGIPLKVESQQGATADEVVAVASLGDDRYRVLLSPGFFRGIAAGDVIVYDPIEKTAELVERGGNIAVQVFFAGLPGDVVESFKEKVKGAGGRIDGELHSLVVLTFPVEVGFTVIESLVATLPEDKVEWEYGNVFDEHGDPLSWWEGAS